MSADKPVKVCPGLDGIRCGQGRKSGYTYCPEHMRQYQRRRYAGMRKAAGVEYVERIVSRTQQELCDCCGCPAEDDLSPVMGAADKLICGQCWRFAQDVIRDFGYGRFNRISEFNVAHPFAFMPRPKAPDARRALEGQPPSAVVVVQATEVRAQYSNELLGTGAKKVTVDQAMEFEYVKAVWARAKAYGFDIDADDTYEFIETNWGTEIRTKLEAAIADGTLVLKTELTEDEAPWLF